MGDVEKGAACRSNFQNRHRTWQIVRGQGATILYTTALFCKQKTTAHFQITEPTQPNSPTAAEVLSSQPSAPSRVGEGVGVD